MQRNNLKISFTGFSMAWRVT